MVYHRIRHLDSWQGTFENGAPPLLSAFLPSHREDLLNYVLYPISFLALRRIALEFLLPIPESLTIRADAHLSALVIFLAPILTAGGEH